jgi:hypothetical protein
VKLAQKSTPSKPKSAALIPRVVNRHPRGYPGAGEIMKLIVRVLLAVGIVLTPFVIGMLVTAVSMVHAFHELGDNGVSDPKQLSVEIGKALIATWLGVVMSTILFFAAALYLLIKFWVRPKGIADST